MERENMKKKISPLQKALNLWAIILIVWSFYRYKFNFPEWFDELLAKPVVFILPVYFFIKKVEGKKFLSSVWLKTKKKENDIVMIGIIGAIFFCAVIGANLIKYNSLTGTVSFKNLIYLILISVLAAIAEETLSRGFILKKIYEDSKNIYTSALYASILFLILHIPILFTDLTLSGSILILYLVNDFILSLANSFIFLERRNLLLPILIHAFYNISLSLFI